MLRVTAPRARPPAAAGRGGRGGGGRRRSVPGGAPAVAAAAGSARPRDGGEAGRESTRCEAAAASGRWAARPSRRRRRRPRIRPAGLCPGRPVTAGPGQPRRRPSSPAGPESHRGECGQWAPRVPLSGPRWGKRGASAACWAAARPPCLPPSLPASRRPRRRACPAAGGGPALLRSAPAVRGRYVTGQRLGRSASFSFLGAGEDRGQARLSSERCPK